MGAIRLFLAWGVLLAHFDHEVLRHFGMQANYIWAFNVIGGRAVLFFYVVSGFLISYVLHEKYPRNLTGTLAFYRARFLRIYPLWWVLLIACLLLDTPPAQHVPATLLPASVLLGSDWIVAFWTFPQTYWLAFPASAEIGWTLGAELTFYLLAPWVLRSNRVALLFLLAAAATRLFTIWAFPMHTPLNITMTYFFFPSTLVFFMLGHFGAVLHRRYSIKLGASLMLLTLTIVILCSSRAGSVSDWKTHAALVSFAAALPGIFAATKDNRIFNFLGDLTYPAYLIHSLIVSALFWPLSLWNGIGSRTVNSVLPLIPSPSLAAILLTGAFLLIVLCAAVLTHFAAERPARFLVGRILDLFVAVSGRFAQFIIKASASDELPPAVGEAATSPLLRQL